MASIKQAQDDSLTTHPPFSTHKHLETLSAPTPRGNVPFSGISKTPWLHSEEKDAEDVRVIIGRLSEGWIVDQKNKMMNSLKGRSSE